MGPEDVNAVVLHHLLHGHRHTQAPQHNLLSLFAGISSSQGAVSFCQGNHSSPRPPLNSPAHETVNVIGILTPSRCDRLCKIVNKQHDGATACRGENREACSHQRLSKEQDEVSEGR